MDCQTARQSLEAARPGIADSAVPELASARAHVQSCAACQSVMQVRNEIDSRIGELCRDVAVPAGMKDRLLSTLQSATKQSSAARSSPREQVDAFSSPVVARGSRPASRRNWYRIVAAMACLLLVGGGSWLLLEQSFATASLDEIDAASDALAEVAPEQLPEFLGFSSGIEVHAPREMKLSQVRVSAPPRQLAVGSTNIEAAVFFLEMTSRGGKTLSGRLTVLPLAKVAAAPPIGGRLFRYVGAEYAAVWTEGDLVFVCYLSGRDAKSELEWRLPVSQAL